MDAVKKGQVKVIDHLGIETTRKCKKLNCDHCMKGNAQNLNIQDGIVDTTFDYFRFIDSIAVLGGEPQLNLEGLEQMYNAFYKYKTKFKNLGLVSNFVEIDNDFFTLLKHIRKLTNANVSIALSNDFWHDKAYERAGIDKQQIIANYDEAKKRNNNIMFDIKPYKSKSEFKLYKCGRAVDIKDAEVQFYKTNPIKDLIFKHSLSWDSAAQMYDISVDAKGNVIPTITDYVTGDRENFGNVLKKPIKYILLEQGKEQ